MIVFVLAGLGFAFVALIFDAPVFFHWMFGGDGVTAAEIASHGLLALFFLALGAACWRKLKELDGEPLPCHERPKNK